MGQEEVLTILKREKRWMLAGEIMAETHGTRSTTNHILKGLFKQDEIDRKEYITRKGKSYLWKYKDTKDVLHGSKKRLEKQ